MMKKKKENEKRKVISVSLAPELCKFLEEETTNKSAYINRMMLDKMIEMGIDLKIKL